MHNRMQTTIGLVICVAAAALMVTGTLAVEIGLVIGTVGMLIVATSSRTARHDQPGKPR